MNDDEPTSSSELADAMSSPTQRLSHACHVAAMRNPTYEELRWAAQALSGIACEALAQQERDAARADRNARDCSRLIVACRWLARLQARNPYRTEADDDAVREAETAIATALEGPSNDQAETPGAIQ